jgi:regulatory protein
LISAAHREAGARLDRSAEKRECEGIRCGTREGGWVARGNDLDAHVFVLGYSPPERPGNSSACSAKYSTRHSAIIRGASSRRVPAAVVPVLPQPFFGVSPLLALAAGEGISMEQMAGKITALRYQKKNPDRVSVYLDGKFAFGLPAIVAARLKRGQFLSDAEVEALQAEGEEDKAYNRALNYLSYRPRSRREIDRYLQERGVPQEQIDAVVGRLERVGFLDDEAFARFWVENRERFRPRGLHALRYELRVKGVSGEIIDRVLETVDAAESAYRSAEKKARQLRSLDQQTFYRKMIGFLSRRGFAYEVAREATDRYWDELADGE